MSAGLALGLGEVGEQRRAVFRLGLRALLAQRGERLATSSRRCCCTCSSCCCSTSLLLRLEIDELRAELVVSRVCADVALPQQRQRRLDLGDRRPRLRGPPPASARSAGREWRAWRAAPPPAPAIRCRALAARPAIGARGRREARARVGPPASAREPRDIEAMPAARSLGNVLVAPPR